MTGLLSEPLSGFGDLLAGRFDLLDEFGQVELVRLLFFDRGPERRHRLVEFLAGFVEQLSFLGQAIGTSACPPYHLAIVIGGTSAEIAVETAKLASAHYLDGLPTAGSPSGHAFRDLDLEGRDPVASPIDATQCRF